jgi:hypothetical protein
MPMPKVRAADSSTDRKLDKNSDERTKTFIPPTNTREY